MDLSWNETSDRRFSIQAYIINNSQLGSFSELEYPVPAIGQGTGLESCHDVSQVWAYRGSRTGIQFVARSLLAPET